MAPTALSQVWCVNLINFFKSSFWRIFTNLVPLCSSSRLAKQFFTVDRAASLLMSTGVYPITESRVCMWELGNWMERVESSFLLLLPQFSTLEIHRLYISMEQKQRATRRRAGCGRLARRSNMLCARHWPLFSCKRKEGGASLKFFEREPMLWRLWSHCLNYFDFSSQFTRIYLLSSL